MSVGARIAKLRSEQGLSQRALGERTGLTGRYIGRLEAGEREGKRETLERVAQELGVTYAELLGAGFGPPTASIPLDGAIEPDGTAASQTLAQLIHPGAFRAAKTAFQFNDRVPVPGARPGQWLMRCDVDLEKADVKAGDQLVMDPEAEPRFGDVVVVTNDTDVYHEEFDAEAEPPITKVKLYRQVDGDVWLWPLVKGDRPEAWEPWWRVVAVAVGVWRALR